MKRLSFFYLTRMWPPRPGWWWEILRACCEECKRCMCTFICSAQFVAVKATLWCAWLLRRASQPSERTCTYGTLCIDVSNMSYAPLTTYIRTEARMARLYRKSYVIFEWCIKCLYIYRRLFPCFAGLRWGGGLSFAVEGFLYFTSTRRPESPAQPRLLCLTEETHMYRASERERVWNWPSILPNIDSQCTNINCLSSGQIFSSVPPVRRSKICLC